MTTFTVPVGASNRHLHVSQADLETLFERRSAHRQEGLPERPGAAGGAVTLIGEVPS